MTVKTLNAEPKVLDVLRSMTFEPSGGGMAGVITAQLDRDLYTQVNKFLEAMGGKWNRKAKAHIFPEDPRSLVAGLMDTGTMAVDNLDFFPTPRDVIERMIILARNHVNLWSARNILEPSAGDGAIADYLIECGFPASRIDVCELDWKRREVLSKKGYRVVGEDFLAYRGLADCVLMNPPFSRLQDIKHVTHAFSLLRRGGLLISVMADGQTWSSDRQICQDFRSLVAAYGNRVELPEGSFHDSGTNVRSCLVYLRKQ